MHAKLQDIGVVIISRHPAFNPKTKVKHDQNLSVMLVIAGKPTQQPSFCLCCLNYCFM
ncbi:hypothetical protein RchiOBHm_Chr3g0454691 [Rosa chinensis]|uniref:Uncharacterized protein n=1 Tax=Rosa chinensis TaxID=74649 RepID=A0A2P6R6Z2_ROSCH|nr:hypothetical protein RchiOBHm_Chr3g0454691 [Rosa chinensis]